MSTPVSNYERKWYASNRLLHEAWAERDEARAELARLKSRITDLVDAGWMSLEAATELRTVYEPDEEGQR